MRAAAATTTAPFAFAAGIGVPVIPDNCFARAIAQEPARFFPRNMAGRVGGFDVAPEQFPQETTDDCCTAALYSTGSIRVGNLGPVAAVASHQSANVGIV